MQRLSTINSNHLVCAPSHRNTNSARSGYDSAPCRTKRGKLFNSAKAENAKDNPALEKNLKKTAERLESVSSDLESEKMKSKALGARLVKTKDLLKTSNYHNLMFLTFYKEFETSLQ